MSFWLHSGWLLLLVPLAMMVACVLMCVFACGFRNRRCMGCCARMQDTQDHSSK